MRFAHRLIAAVTLLAAATAPALALAGPAAARTPAGSAVTRLWAARFDGSAGRSATAGSVATSPDGSTVYVTGLTSEGGSTPMNTYDTVAYNAATGATLWVARFRGGNGRHPEGPLPAVTVSPDGSKVFVFGHFPSRSFGFRGEYQMLAYNATTGAQLWTASGTCQFPARAIAVSPDSSTVYATGTLGSDYCTLAYNTTTGAVLWQANYQVGQHIHTFANALALSPDGSDLFVTGTAGTVAYGASTGTQLWADHYKQRWGRSDEHVAVSPDGSTVFVAGATTVTKPEHFLTVAYNAATGAQIWAAQKSPSTFASFASAVAVSPDGSGVFVTGPSLTSNGTPPAYLTIGYNAATGAALWVRRLADPGGNFDTLPSLAVSPDGSAVIMAGSMDQANGQLGYAVTSYAAATGARLWAARYQGPGGGASTAAAVTASGSNVFVTGTSARDSTQNDYATIAVQG